mmetsp:Transcript_9398/g.30661  ORF Transcript_9398/g.30661 Transcript_9398/m.30661 type:complete len:351 (-) Transcript_9398:54-1106(-)
MVVVLVVGSLPLVLLLLRLLLLGVPRRPFGLEVVVDGDGGEFGPPEDGLEEGRAGEVARDEVVSEEGVVEGDNPRDLRSEALLGVVHQVDAGAHGARRRQFRDQDLEVVVVLLVVVVPNRLGEDHGGAAESGGPRAAEVRRRRRVVRGVVDDGSQARLELRLGGRLEPGLCDDRGVPQHAPQRVGAQQQRSFLLLLSLLSSLSRHDAVSRRLGPPSFRHDLAAERGRKLRRGLVLDANAEGHLRHTEVGLAVGIADADFVALLQFDFRLLGDLRPVHHRPELRLAVVHHQPRAVVREVAVLLRHRLQRKANRHAPLCPPEGVPATRQTDPQQRAQRRPLLTLHLLQLEHD